MLKRLVNAIERIANSLLIIELVLMKQNNIKYDDLSDFVEIDEKEEIEKYMYQYQDEHLGR